VLKHAILRAAKAAGLFRVARSVTSGGLRVLAYHGFEIADETSFRPHLFISATDFAARMALLAEQRYPVLPLSEALERLRAGTLPRAAVAITIDDGFYSVRAVAAAILRRHSFPATVYVTTYYAGRNAPIFRHAVRYMFHRTTARHLDATGRGWGLDGVLAIDTASARERAAEAIIRYGESECTEAQRQDICRDLGSALGVDYDHIRRTRILSLMTGVELRELAAFGIDAQLHTHRHRFPVDREVVFREIRDNCEALDELAGPEPRVHFCYPSGQYVCSQWPWLQELGIQSATTCEPGFNYTDTPPLGLRRFLDDSQVSLLTFEAELSGFLELARLARAYAKAPFAQRATIGTHVAPEPVEMRRR